MRNLFLPVIIILFLSGCGAGKSSLNYNKKYAAETLQKDYTVFRNMLEESHPGIYWYTSKESMDGYFDWGKQQLKDSMTEPEFKKILSYVISKINCGHTVVKNSKSYSKYLDTVRTKTFPFSVKIWPDTIVVAFNLQRKDSLPVRGSVIKKINGLPVEKIIDSLFQFISTDGYNITHKNQSLSNRGNFGSNFTSVFGEADKYTVEFIDSNNKTVNTVISAYKPLVDSAARNALRRLVKMSKKERRKQLLQNRRSLRIDTAGKTAVMDVNTFQKNAKLKKFFKKSFKSLQETKVKNLIIDVRSNGGGNVMNSTLLTKYITNNKFKIADSLYAFTRKSRYGRYIESNFFNRFFMLFVTRKKTDGKYHFGYFERHFFKPKKKNHFDGQVFILIGGNSFSATTLFANAVIKQENVLVAGEETGGGAYGNTAWLIPDVRLPETKLRFRLPLMRLVIDKTIPKIGRGVQPELESLPTVEAIRHGRDFKMDKVREIIAGKK
jgi:Peptidase family S41